MVPRRMEGFSRAFPKLTTADVRSGFCLTRPEYSIELPTDSRVSACALNRRRRFEHHARDRSRKSDFRCWHFREVPTASSKVRFQGQHGRHLLSLSSSQF